jgi:pimeloyl-ACP methyl ester carboxylesterase
VRKAGEPVHLVGHSFGGLVSLAVALRGEVELASLAIFEAPAIELLSERSEHHHHRSIGAMTQAYFASFESGNSQAIATMIDFYGGEGTFASWPARVRAYAVETTPVNILDWASAYGFALSAASLRAIEIPTLVAIGSGTHPAMRTLAAHLSDCIGGAHSVTIDGAAHFMIASHADEVAALIATHVDRVERGA